MNLGLMAPEICTTSTSAQTTTQVLHYQDHVNRRQISIDALQMRHYDEANSLEQISLETNKINSAS